MNAADFYDALHNSRDSLTQAQLIDYFAYFQQVIEGRAAVTAAGLGRTFTECDLVAPARLSTHLSEKSKGRNPTYVKTKVGYRLHHAARTRLQAAIDPMLSGPVAEAALPRELQDLEARLPVGPRREFLHEALKCFDVGAYRATIVMMWLLTLDQLFDYVLGHQLTAFNTVLAANTDKRVKVTTISGKDDFSDIPEGKFIEFLRSAKIISNDVRKILDTKLGIRNSAAHPSGVSFSRAKAIDFAEDLVNNVIVKYPL